MFYQYVKCPHGQAVKTSPSHGGIWGSIPHGGTKKSYTSVWDFFLPNGALCVIRTQLRCTNPRTSGLAFRYMSKLTRSTITFTTFSTIPHGGTKNPTQACGIFLPNGELCVVRTQLCCTNPRNWAGARILKINFLCLLLRSLRSLRFPMGVPISA